jgi:hypothetical protein
MPKRKPPSTHNGRLLAAVQHHLVNARPMKHVLPHWQPSAVAATVAVAVEIAW